MSDFFKTTGGTDSVAYARVDTGGESLVKSVMTSGGNVSVQTNADGVSYVALTSQECKKLVIVNDTATSIEFRQDGAGVALPIANGASFTIQGITNANQVSVRRVDTAITQVTVKARWEA